MKELIPLSRINPKWRGGIIPSAFEALERGIEREKARLTGSTYLTLLFRNEYDIDGLLKHLNLLEGFTDEETAVSYIDRLAEQTLKEELDGKGWSLSKVWRHEVDQDNKRFRRKKDNPRVQGVYLRSFKIKGDSGVESKYFQFEVLRIGGGEGIGPDLFGYFDEAANEYASDSSWHFGVVHEWTSFFIGKGMKQ